jgi:hypothetical protein
MFLPPVFISTIRQETVVLFGGQTYKVKAFSTAIVNPVGLAAVPLVKTTALNHLHQCKTLRLFKEGSADTTVVAVHSTKGLR